MGGAALIGATQNIGAVACFLPWSDEPLLLQPWQLSFLLASAPGPISVIAALARRHVQTYVAVYGAMALVYAFIYGAISWLPTLFLRKFGIPETKFGHWFGLAALVAGVLGTIASTTLVGRLQSRGRADAHLLTIIIFVVVGGPAMIAGALTPHPIAAFACFAPAMFFLTGLVAIPQTALQVIVPNQARALSTAAYHFVMNAIGASTGPLLVAAISERVLGDEATLDIAVALIGLVTIPMAAWICYRSRSDFRASMLEARNWQ